MTRQSPYGWFKYSRVLFFYSGILARYLILLLLSIKLTVEARWLSGKGVYPIINRTWVRIPGPPYALYFFSSGYHM